MQKLRGAISTATHGTGHATAPCMPMVGLRLVTARGPGESQQRPDPAGRQRVSLLERHHDAGAGGSGLQPAPPRGWNLRDSWAALNLPASTATSSSITSPFTGYAAGIAHDIDTSGQGAHAPHAADEDVLRDLRRLRDWLRHFPALRRKGGGLGPSIPIRRKKPRTAPGACWATQRPTLQQAPEYHVPQKWALLAPKEVIARAEKRNGVYFPMGSLLSPPTRRVSARSTSVRVVRLPCTRRL